jgi:hypothetical protein
MEVYIFGHQKKLNLANDASNSKILKRLVNEGTFANQEDCPLSMLQPEQIDNPNNPKINKSLAMAPTLLPLGPLVAYPMA